MSHTIQQPKFFRQPKPETPSTEPKKSHHVGRKVLILFLVCISLAAIGYIGYKMFVFSKQVSDNWQEVWFAIEKPAIVKMVRTRYQNKEAILDKEFLTGQSSEQEMVDQIKQAIRSETQTKPAPTVSPYQYRY